MFRKFECECYCFPRPNEPEQVSVLILDLFIVYFSLGWSYQVLRDHRQYGAGFRHRPRAMGEALSREVCFYIIDLLPLSFFRKQMKSNVEAGVKGEEAEMLLARLSDSNYVPGDPYPGSIKH